MHSASRDWRGVALNAPVTIRSPVFCIEPHFLVWLLRGFISVIECQIGAPYVIAGRIIAENTCRALGKVAPQVEAATLDKARFWRAIFA